jgi:hypothetical protein
MLRATLLELKREQLGRAFEAASAQTTHSTDGL